jgi:hypothetical protein
MASEFLNIDSNKTQIVSIGSKTYENTKIGNTVGVLEWIYRMISLLGPVKK